MRSLGWVLMQGDCIIIKMSNLGTEAEVPTGRMLCGCEDRDGGNLPISQGKPKITIRSHNLGKGHTTVSSISLRQNQPCRHLDLGLQATRTLEIHFCGLSHQILGNLYGRPWRLTQLPGLLAFQNPHRIPTLPLKLLHNNENNIFYLMSAY